MPDKILENLLSGQLDPELVLTWLRGDNLEGSGEDCPLRHCGRNEFTAYFLSYLRAETDSIIDNDSGLRAVIGSGTPERSDGRAHRRAASDPTAESPARPHHSPNRDKKRSGRKVKTKLFNDEKNKEPASPDDVRITAGIDRIALASSTPLKNDSTINSSRGDSTRSPLLTPSERPRHSRHEHTFGDFLSTASSTKLKKKRNSRASDDSSQDISLDATPNSANSSGRKCTSLRSEKRRIKPTNIDLSNKSVSLTSFNSEFQKVGVLALENNEVFSAPPLSQGGNPGFAAERDALRRERHRLLEKFSSLSAATSPKCSTPLIKISQQEDNYILPDISKVTHEDTIQILVNIYQILLDFNMALSYTSELCFMLALLRGRQKQKEDENFSITEPRTVLRSVHNAACFAARALRTQRSVLSVLLDRPSLRALAEARATKAMAPDLSKSLLDVYGVRGETVSESSSSSLAPAPPAPPAGHVVAWNTETDGADNFPTTLSFHSFKKQRDMFYEIARWYEETGGSTNVAGPSLRTRVRALLAAGAQGGQANYAHLGVLVARHAIATVSGNGAGQESRLSKLQRRLTRRPANQGNSIFTPEEEFYRELLSCSENEPFRAALRDAFATELLALDAAPVHTGAALVSISRRASTLAKLLGLLAALPYCPQHQPVTTRPVRPLPYILALRSYAQPALDLHSAVLGAAVSGRLCVSAAWVCAYLCALAASDAQALRLPTYVTLLALLRTVYSAVLGAAVCERGVGVLRLPTYVTLLALLRTVYRYIYSVYLHSAVLGAAVCERGVGVLRLPTYVTLLALLRTVYRYIYSVYLHSAVLGAAVCERGVDVLRLPTYVTLLALLRTVYRYIYSVYLHSAVLGAAVCERGVDVLRLPTYVTLLALLRTVYSAVLGAAVCERGVGVRVPVRAGGQRRTGAEVTDVCDPTGAAAYCIQVYIYSVYLHSAVLGAAVCERGVGVLRLPTYVTLLALLRTVYRRRVPCLPMRSSLYLRCTLSTLFAHAHIPQELLYEDETEEVELPTNANGLDYSDIITETELGALLGARKEVRRINR
ncbi:hypothetical protein O0L34_g12259 [Tuta absoluta]|nr:hypothetical protein O0L34_g12259 [Tuta absoluta]